MIFKIKAKDGYIAASADHVSFRKGQYFYALAYHDETECYFVSTQYATPFARTAVCGFVPEKYFETVSLNGKDPPHPLPSQYRKALAEDAERSTPDSSKASKGSQGDSSTLARLRSSKSVGNLRDTHRDDEDVEDERVGRREESRAEVQQRQAEQAAQVQQQQQQKEQKTRGRSLSMKTLRRRGKSNPPPPDMNEDEGPADVSGGQEQRNQASGGSNIVIPPRRTFIPNLMASSTTTPSSGGSKPGSSAKKKKEPKAFQTLDRSFRLFNFSTWSERPPQTSKTPGAPTTAAATSTHLRHETPVSGGTLSPTLIIPSVANPQPPVSLGKPLPLPPMPSVYAEAVKQQQQMHQTQHQQPATRPSSPGADIISATIVEAMKQSGPINLTRYVIAVTLRSSPASSNQRVTTVTKSYEDFVQFHGTLTARFSSSVAAMRRPSTETGFYAAAANSGTRTPPDSPTPNPLPELPAAISNVAELRRRFLLDARLQSQMTELNGYLAQLVKTSTMVAKCLESFLVASSASGSPGLDEGVSFTAVRATTPPVERGVQDSGYGLDQYQQQQQIQMVKSRSRSKSEAPFLSSTGTAKESMTSGGIFTATLATLRRSKSRTRVDRSGGGTGDGQGSVNSSSYGSLRNASGYEDVVTSSSDLGGSSNHHQNVGGMSLNKLMTAFRSGSVPPPPPPGLIQSAHREGGARGGFDEGSQSYGGSPPQVARSAISTVAPPQPPVTSVSTPNVQQHAHHIQQQQQRAQTPSSSTPNPAQPIPPPRSVTPIPFSAATQHLQTGSTGATPPATSRIGMGGTKTTHSSFYAASQPQQYRPTGLSTSIGQGGVTPTPMLSSAFSFQPPSPPSPIAQNFASEVMAGAGMDQHHHHQNPTHYVHKTNPSTTTPQTLPRHQTHQTILSPTPTEDQPDHNVTHNHHHHHHHHQNAAASAVAANGMLTGWGKMMARLGVAEGGGGAVPIRQRSTSLGWDAGAGGPPNHGGMVSGQQGGLGASAAFPDKATVKMMMQVANQGQGGAVRRKGS
ncbi:hypothetical protein HDU67_001295, partial [Dinochytrium kinnereticum]